MNLVALILGQSRCGSKVELYAHLYQIGVLHDFAGPESAGLGSFFIFVICSIVDLDDVTLDPVSPFGRTCFFKASWKPILVR